MIMIDDGNKEGGCCTSRWSGMSLMCDDDNVQVVVIVVIVSFILQWSVSQ
jgi:hypothetical protein